MSSLNPQGDPRTGRDRRSPTRARTFQDGKVDPVINNKRPLLTIGNGVLLVVGVGYGMYATGHLPQFDAFFNHLDEVGKANNNTVVNALITYGTAIFGCIVLSLIGLVLFSVINTRRRRVSDPKGWQKIANAPPERRKQTRRVADDLPSLIMPIGKERPERLRKEKPAAPPAAAATETASPAIPPKPKEAVSPAKLAAIEAAKKAEAAADAAPADLPSFVLPYGKNPKPPTKVMKSRTEMSPETAESAPSSTPSAPLPPQPVAVQVAIVAVNETPSAPDAKAEAAIAAARAAALKAEAVAAAAKAEAALAIAKAEAAAAEAMIAAAKAEAQPA